MQTKDIPLHDIKPLIEIQEYSLYYFIALVVGVSIIVLALVYLIYRYIKKRNSFNIRANHLKLLQTMDFSDAKKAAYDITQYAALFANDSDEHEEAFNTLVENLGAYKYKKDVNSFDEETKRSIENYLGMLNV